MKDDQLMENASLTFLQLICVDVIVTTTDEKRDVPRNILMQLDRNAYQTTRTDLGRDNYLMTTTLTFLNDQKHRELFKKLMFRIRLEFGERVMVKAKDKRVEDAR